MLAYRTSLGAPSKYSPAAQETKPVNTHRATLSRVCRTSPDVLPVLSASVWSRRYFGSSIYKKWGESNKCATTLEIYNAEFSPIYTLPPELILKIADHYLLAADILSLHLSSRRFASLIRRVLRATKQRPMQHEKKELWERLERDRYFKLANNELASATLLLCSHCRKPHPPSMFTPGESVKSAHVRQCIGITSQLRACPHVSFTYKQLKAWLTFEAPFEDTFAFSVCSLWPYDSRCTLRPKISPCTYTGQMIYKSDYMSKSFTKDFVASRPNIRQQLAQLAEPICPHMRTDDDIFRRCIMETPTIASPYVITRLFAAPGTSSYMNFRCAAKGCDTRITIKWIPDFNRGGVLGATVHRNLGKLKDPLDPAWLAQVGVEF